MRCLKLLKVCGAIGRFKRTDGLSVPETLRIILEKQRIRVFSPYGDAAQAEEAVQIYASAGATMKCGTVYAVGYKV
jgi:hypothetical protein